MGDAPRPVLPVAAGAVPEVPPVPRRSLGDSPNPFRKPSQHSVSASVSPPVPAVPSVSASTPGPAPGAADTSSPAHNPFRPGSSAATPTPAPPLPRRPSITASPSPARPPLPPRQPSMPSSPAHRLHVRAASVAGTERTITPRKMASAPPAPVAVPATASASPAPVPAKPAPPKPPKPAGFITSSATPLSPLIRESLAAARERRAVEAADPGRKKHVEVIRSSNPLAMFAQAQANAQAQSSASSGSSGAHPGNAPHHAHARRRTVLTGDGEGMEREQVDTTTDDGSRASDADGVDAAEESMDEDEIRAALGKARSRSFGTLKDLPAAEEKDQRRRDVLPPPPRRRPDSMQVLPPGSKARRAGNTGGLSRHSSLSLPPPPPYQPPTLPSLSHLLSQTKQSLDLGVEKLSLAAQQAHATHARHPSGEKLASSVGNAVSLELQRLKRGSVSRGYVGVEGEGWGRRGVGEQPLMGEVEEGEDRESPFGPVGPGLGRGLTPYGGDGDEGEVFADQRTKGDEGWVRLS
ncbi:hypothetical protein CALVIDRAFT_565888 [Calocera viscosa TUFC12733]|uniref:Uncharacterized protein n=1 Tax=Calocera viscosa (strain TUFC12733) TaxID=1330018 RepID=A0A167K494_CALVF|nr:hypothetical protein CALVIDRAFT_565888 [Calocera viscosa TUFC12733]